MGETTTETLAVPQGWTIGEPVPVTEAADQHGCWWCEGVWSGNSADRLVMVDQGDGEGPVPVHAAPAGCVEEMKRRAHIRALITTVGDLTADFETAEATLTEHPDYESGAPDQLLWNRDDAAVDVARVVTRLLPLLKAEGRYS